MSVCPSIVLSLGLGAELRGSHRNPSSGCSWSGDQRGQTLLALASLRAAQERKGGHCAGWFCDQHPYLSVISVCSPRVRKGLICLFHPSLAGYLPVGFIVSWDQIREGMAKGGDTAISNFSSGIPALPTQECCGCSFALSLTQPLCCSWAVPPHGAPTCHHHTQGCGPGCGDNQGRLTLCLLLPQGAGLACLTWKNISRREDRSISSGSSTVLDRLKPGCVPGLRWRLGAA